jgi:adenylate cyclase
MLFRIYVQKYYREFTWLFCTLGAVLIAATVRAPFKWDGQLLDLLIKARSIIFPSANKEESAVAVIALDRRSLESPELARYPRVMLAPVWAKIVDALFKAKIQEVGFDLIFAYDANQFPGIAPDFNAPFLKVLHEHQDRIALARSDQPPVRSFVMAAGGNDALGLAEITPDSDGRYRHVRNSYDTDAGPALSLAGLLIERAAGAPRMPPEVLLAPRRHLETIPAYSVIDVLRCITEPEILESAFRGKIVVIGSTVPEEDREECSGRLLNPVPQDSAPIASCGLRLLGASDPRSDTVPGVFLHAAAVDAVVGRHLTETAPRTIITAAAAVAGAAAALVTFLLTPWSALGAVAAIAIALFGAAVGALQAGWWIPLAMPLYVLVATPAICLMMRYLVEVRTRRQVQRAFNHYLAPAIVDRLASDPSALRLGGEYREVTVMFADLSGFTALSMQVRADILTAKVNQYLGYVVEQVEARGGYVDKFIGDSVMALWGAPVADPEHALNAVRAAMAAADCITHAQQEDEALGELGLSIKIGVNSGDAVVGNVGTENRYNYTAVGEIVNLASRLEGIPPLYHCRVLVGPRTAQLVGSEFLMRELDWVQVKGASKPLALYEPIIERSRATDQQNENVARFAQALSRYREGRFADAYAIWEELAAEEGRSPIYRDGMDKWAPNPASAMATRARQLMEQPPGATWNAVRILTTK